jgi:hypothetical protein
MDTYITGRIEMSHGAKLANVQVYMNNKRMEIDEIGGFSVNISEILAPESARPGVMTLQAELEESSLTREQIRDFWYLLGGSKSIIIQDVSTSLNIDRREAKELLMKGIACKVLSRGYNSVWKVIDKMTREKIMKTYKEMNEEHTLKGRSVDEMLKDITTGANKTAKEIAEAEKISMREQKELEEMSREGESEVVSSNEPAKVFIGMKGGTKIQNKEVTKKEVLQTTAKHVGVIVPKKKPLESKPIRKKKVS